MRKLFFVLISICLINLHSCDDGDVITFNLDFEDEFVACEGVNDLVLYKTKNDPSESLSVIISNYTKADLINLDENNQLEEIITNCTFNYRAYSNESVSNLFCNDIPSSEIIITSDEESNCTVSISTSLTEDDNDGIPAELEDLNGNGNLEDDDTDGDGLPNYKDADDDGDNILTKDENPDPNGDGDLSDAQNTDANFIIGADNKPDYLDPDDDGDGVDTRDEENDSQDQRPANDITNNDVGPDYLNPDVSTSEPATAYRSHTYKKTYLVIVNLGNVVINNATFETFSFGTLSDSSTSETITIKGTDLIFE